VHVTRYHPATTSPLPTCPGMAASACSSLLLSAWPRGANSPWTPRVLGRHGRVHALSTRASVGRSHRGHARYDAIGDMRRYERSRPCLSVSSSPRMPSRERVPNAPRPWPTAAVPCSRNPAVSSSRSFRVPWTPIRSSHSNAGPTRRRSTHTRSATPPGRRTRRWRPSAPTASAPGKTPSTIGRGSPACAGPAGRPRPLQRLEGCAEWHVGEEACGSPLHDGLASGTLAVRESRVC
jgi:hypothetical protein